MLTTVRAWMRASQGHGHGFSGDLERIDQCSKSRRRKLLMRRAPAMHLRDEVAKQNVELWYSRKRKKKKNAISVAAEESEMARKVDMDSTPCVCSDCGTSRTPLWRRGPAGPKSLCNACGIRYRKTKKTTSASKEEKISRKREALWLLMEESGKLELPCGKEAVEAAVLLMAMSSGLLSVLMKILLIPPC